MQPLDRRLQALYVALERDEAVGGKGVRGYRRRLEPFASDTETAAGLLELLWALSGLDVLLATRVDSDSDLQHITAALVDGQPAAMPSVVWSGSACARMVAGQAPEVAPRLADVPAYAEAPNMIGTGMACFIGVPVHRGDGLLYGTVCGFGRTPRDESMRNLLPVFRTVGRLLGGLLASAEAAEERLAEAKSQYAQQLGAALTDPVTGLANRTGLEQAVAREQARRQRYGHAVTVIVCDVDGLKTVNDRSGHEAGDALLRQVADRLRAATRASDVLGRLGGDEFLLVLPGETLDGSAVNRLRADLSDLPVSLGAADTREDPSLTVVRARADRRMYEAKRLSASREVSGA